MKGRMSDEGRDYLWAETARLNERQTCRQGRRDAPARKIDTQNRHENRIEAKNRHKKIEKRRFGRMFLCVCIE